ncbi:general transcription factor 3C polypeptide 1 isoform X3 [Strongylocentrotus purpuratus]|uniref:Uncharacterized protein n=1 Tax=Strongylocentrotus purpuratus TaxID=7668 RepID=A0A7M7PSE0_STRPU|nr:general transcription factor 3C polypeptide 1 isoform X3 [Strongylocentrotus purpuratus]
MEDLEDIVLDEIALEGLDGVSLERLWILLEQRPAQFHLKCDDYTKNFIWQDLLCHHQTISFYTVPEEFLQLDESVVEEKKPSKKKKRSKTNHQANEAMIDDPETKDRGYCLCYEQRKDVTAEIRKGTKSGCLSLQQVIKKWGNSLVLVASQEARLHALISQVTTADVPLFTIQYCCLEHVGKCRYLGASQPSISVRFDVDLSYVFHMCKKLLKHGVVVKKTIENLAHIYLIRFQSQCQITRKTKVIDNILDFIATQPHNTCPRYELVEHVLKSEEEVSYNQFKKALRALKTAKLAEAVSIVAKELPQYSCPEVAQSMKEHLTKIKAQEGDAKRKPEDFIITCIRLVDQSSIADNSVEDHDDDDTDLVLKGINAAKEIDFSKLHFNIELTDTQQVYYYVEKNQNELNGVSINETMHALMMDRYRVRVIFKRLARKELMRSFTFMTGRAREMRFFTQHGLDEGTVPKQVLQMYHQGEKKPLVVKQTPTKVDDPAGILSSAESSPGVSQSTGKSKPVSQDAVPAGKSKITKAWKNLERSRLILEHVAYVRVVEIPLLFKYIKKTEAEMGSKTECCRKSLFRMVINLAKDKKLNYFVKEIQRKEGNKIESVKIVSHASIGDDDPQVQAVLDKIIVKPHFAPQPVKMPHLYRKLKGKPGKKTLAMSDLLKSKMQHTHEKRKIMERYGYTGKMERLDALHRFLWHLIYESKEVGEVKLEPLEKLSSEDLEVGPVKLEPSDTTLSSGAKENSETSAMPPGCTDHQSGQDIDVAPRIKNSTTADKTGQSSKDESTTESEEIPQTHIECYAIKNSTTADKTGQSSKDESTTESEENSTTADKTGQSSKDESTTESEEIPQTHIECYLDTTDPLDWRRYVPPGRGHVGRVKGWATMNDILLALPLSLYCKMNSVLRDEPGLDEALAHPRMRHYPINVLRLKMFHGCDIKRTIGNLHNCLLALSGMGLIYFDRDQRNQLRTQVNFYLCRSGSFLDTTSSAPGSDQTEEKEYPRRTYNFTSLDNVAQYWLDFKMTCFSTPLGVIKLQCCKAPKDPKAPKEGKMLSMVADSIYAAPPDPTTIPGDHRGAGGLDTSFYAHRSGNWDKIKCRSTEVKKSTRKKKKKKKSESEGEVGEKEAEYRDGVKVVKVEASEHKKATAGGKGQKRKPLKVKSKPEKSKVGEERSSVPGQTDQGPVEGAAGDKSMVEIASQKGKKLKKARPQSKPKPKSRSHLVRNLHIYDDEDLIAAKRKILRRVKWSAREDNLILLCGLSLRILRVKCAKSDTVKRFVTWAVVRDVLQENLEESYDKTAASAARRFRLLLKDYTNMSNFSVCLTDVRADKDIMTEFMSRKRDYDLEATRQQEFRELVMRLAKKFESQDKSAILAIPSTLEELYEMYDLMNSSLPVATTMEEFESRDVKSEEEITFSILFKIVLISMLSHHFKQHDMREIYFVLRQYDPLMLQRAVDSFKSHGFMGRNRNGVMDSINTKRAMHVVPMSFQFTKTFFNLFNAPTIPSEILGETSTILGDILTACRQESDQTSTEEGEAAAVCIDDMKGNKSSILCIPALELASDSVDIPKDIISLELSDRERKRLQKKHEVEMMRELEDCDLDDEDDDDSLSEKPREGKRKASEISEDLAPRKMLRQLVGDVGRKKVAFVRTAHKEWCQTQTDKQVVSEPEKTTKGTMRSLIPRLLVNADKENVDMDSSSSKATEPSQEPVIYDSAVTARRSLALDHDYFIHEEDKAPETSQDGNQSEVSSRLTSGEADAPPENTTQVDYAASPCKAPSDGASTAKSAKTSDSFFTWLTMRGFLTQEYSKKPQNIHEDITVRRCSIHLKPTACLFNILDKFYVPSKQEPHEQDPMQDMEIPEDNASRSTQSSQPSNSASEGQGIDAEVTGDTQHTPTPSRNGTSAGKLIPHEKTMNLPWHSESKSKTVRTIAPGHVQSIGELLCQPCGPVQAFRSPTPNSELGPSLEYTVKEPCRSLEDICKGHKQSELFWTIFQHVKAAGALGLTYPQLFDSLGQHRERTRTRVFNCLRILLQEQFLLEVGTTVLRLVAQESASKWLLKSVKSIALPTTTPPESSGLVNPAKKTKVSEQSIPQEGVTNGDHTVRDEHQTPEGGRLPDMHDGTLPIKQVDSSKADTNKRLQEASITSGGERSEIERDKQASIEDRLAEAVATDEDTSSSASGLKGKKRKKGDKKERIQPEVRHEPVTILSHPWTNIDGSVSTKSLTMFVSSLGLLIISKPGMKESDIFHHFQDVMAPVECLHLIKILVNAEIITRHSTYTSVKLNLFDPPSNTKPRATFFYQPTVWALMNLALLRDNLAKSKGVES